MASDRRVGKGSRVVLGEMIRQVKDKVEDPALAGITHYLPGGGIHANSLAIENWQPVNDGVMGPAFHMRFQPGHTLYKSRVPHGVGVADRVGICANTTYVLEPVDETVLLPGLLPYILKTNSFRDFEEQNNRGSTNLFLNFSDIARYEFSLPSLPEQRKLVRLLGAIDSCATEFLNASRSADDLRASFVAHLVLGSSRSSSLDDLSPASLPSGWALQPASELCTSLITKGATPSQELTEADTGIPFLKVYNLTFDGRLDFSVKPAFVTDEGHQGLRRSSVSPGDVLMNIVGPPLGKVSLIPADFPESNINQAIVRYRLDNQQLALWFAEYLLSPSAQSWLHARSKKTSGQRNLTLAVCRDLPVPTPPIGEVEAVLRPIRAMREQAQKSKQRADNYRVLEHAVIEEQLGDESV